MKHQGGAAGKRGAHGRAGVWVRRPEKTAMPRLFQLAVLAGLTLSLAACACRPGVVGPYGARPPRCWVW
jgi:hypothetical protein